MLLLSHFSCVQLHDPIDNSPPGSSVHGILQARILEWAAVSFSNACMHAKSLQSCLTLCDPMDSSPPGSSVHRILLARILDWVAISFSLSLSLSLSLYIYIYIYIYINKIIKQKSPCAFQASVNRMLGEWLPGVLTHPCQFPAVNPQSTASRESQAINKYMCK